MPQTCILSTAQRWCHRKALLFSERNMDGFLGTCLLMAYATAVVALTIAPNVAEAFPPFILDAILKAGRTEEKENE
ncbi:hypothetical protein MRX96_049900 [Rhipicephalus microplus]